jgi:dTDP-4-amino-4,6-dideoxygalactose transaminase
VHSYVHWVIAAPRRDRLARELARRGVQTKPYFPAQHLHHEISAPGLHLPVTERLDRQALALPMSSELSQAQADALADALEEAFSTPAEDRQPRDAGCAARLRSPAYRVSDSDARGS